MALFRNIGNRLRRADDPHAPSTVDNAPLGGTGGGGGTGAAAPPLSNKAGSIVVDEQPDLYVEDRELGHSIRELEEVRAALRSLTDAAIAHKESLIATARTESLLGEQLSDMLRAGGGECQRAGSVDSLTIPDENNSNEGSTSPRHFARFLRSEDREAQAELGRGLGSHADSTVKLANAFANPLAELQRSFEERFARKIIPLRKRYADQKGQYLKYKRNADFADNDDRRANFEALAEASKPVWGRTSTELRTECTIMAELTSRNMAKWSRALALQHERALAVASANLREAFTQAKANNITGR